MGGVSVLQGSRPLRRGKRTVKPVEILLVTSLQRKTINHPRCEVGDESSQQNRAQRAIIGVHTAVNGKNLLFLLQAVSMLCLN